jgi:hypothetical protein
MPAPPWPPVRADVLNVPLHALRAPLPAALVDRGDRRLLHPPRRQRQALAYVYFEEEPSRRAAAKLLTRDEARHRRQHRRAVAGQPWGTRNYQRPSLARRGAFGGEGLSAKLTAVRRTNPMDQRIESFLADVLALAGEDLDAVREGVRVALASCEALFPGAGA